MNQEGGQRVFQFPFNHLRQFAQNVFIKWINKRQAISDSYTLHQKNLYIFPTAIGNAFLLLAIIIWLLGTNYQNNLILALAYMQVSLFVATILNTFNNLSNLEVDFNHVEKVFLGEVARFHFTVKSPNKSGAHYIYMGWGHNQKLNRGKVLANRSHHLYDFDSAEKHLVEVCVQSGKRGYFYPKHLYINSTFPMGLLRCGTWLSFNIRVLVFPEPIACPLPQPILSDEDFNEVGELYIQGDDFKGFCEYQPGDSIKHISWKLFAKEQGLYRKEYDLPVSMQCRLNWSDFFKGDVELCLSYLCFWALQHHRQGKAFSLTLPNLTLEFSRGDQHLNDVLTALALYQQGGT